MREIIDYSTFAVDVISLTLLYGALFERRLKPFAFWSIFVISIIPYWCLLVYLPWPNIWFKQPVNIIWGLFIGVFYKGSWLHRICVFSVYYVIMIGIDVVLYGMIMNISGNTMQNVLGNEHLSNFSAVIAHIILFMIFFFLAKLMASRKVSFSMPLWEWMPILTVICFTVLQLHFGIRALQENTARGSMLLIQAILLMLINVALLLILNKLATRHVIQQENTSLQEQMRHESLRLQAANDNFMAQRSLTHDFENRLVAIEQLLQDSKYEHALSYIQEVRATVAQTDVAVSTNNPLADAILNQKYRKAQEMGIAMQFLVSDLSSFPLSGDELVTVLSNLLDNALEACRHICAEENDAQTTGIRVKLMMEPTFATISVKNTSLPINVSADGDVLTTKKDSLIHGFGLKNCKKILKHADFEFAVCYRDGWFQFTAIKAF